MRLIIIFLAVSTLSAQLLKDALGSRSLICNDFSSFVCDNWKYKTKTLPREFADDLKFELDKLVSGKFAKFSVAYSFQLQKLTCFIGKNAPGHYNKAPHM